MDDAHKLPESTFTKVKHIGPHQHKNPWADEPDWETRRKAWIDHQVPGDKRPSRAAQIAEWEEALRVAYQAAYDPGIVDYRREREESFPLSEFQEDCGALMRDGFDATEIATELGADINRVKHAMKRIKELLIDHPELLDDSQYELTNPRR